jgi:hypothetical protein
MPTKNDMNKKLCGCGSIHDAMAEAERRLMTDIENGFCLSWAAQMAAAHTNMFMALGAAINYPLEEIVKILTEDSHNLTVSLDFDYREGVVNRIRAKLDALQTDKGVAP